jgi:phosphate transport system permease protein
VQKFFRSWFASGEPWIWLNAASVGISITAVVGILLLIGVKGFGHFWPSDVELIEFQDESGQQHLVYGELVENERLPVQQFLESGGVKDWVGDNQETIERWLVKTGNRRHNPPDFRWLYTPQMTQRSAPGGVAALERIEWGNAYGRLSRFENGDTKETLSVDDNLLPVIEERIDRANGLRDEIDALENGTLNRINYQLERLRLEERGIQLRGGSDLQRLEDISAEVLQLRTDYAADEKVLRALYQEIQKDTLWTNTEGGIFPAIFGTVLMVLLMSIIVTPFGVIAAVYLREYARQGPLVRIIRIAVNNLAGVPSIVYGVFGLGFFVYFVGANLDQLFYPEALPAPTFGTPGLVWASLTLALLTVPVVIVSTEEGLTRIPRSLREGSLALGATKSETLFKVILPMASPAILTGVILAVARAAGEVAPLMLVGVVKLAPTLPLDGNFPYLHLDRKFMHLGFHIYDVGFQSPNVEAARPLVYATALLLVTIIVALNLTAITLRSRLERRYRGVES